MACQMSVIAHLFDVESVKRRLFPNNPERTANSNASSDSWVWPDEDLYDDPSTSHQKLPAKDVSWLQECHTSMSSTTERLVISHKNNMVILTSKWDMQEEGDVKTKYHITWHGNPCQQPEEQITSILCLPIISQGKSTHCGPDWTCIVVGFSSGYIRFYTENCNFLLSEMLHNEPVSHLKCQSYQTPQYSPSREPAEEIYVVYKTAVCIVQGFGLFQTLRACRNQLARVQANCKEVIQAPPLAFKKWGFQEQESIADCEVVGPSMGNTFDHLQTASICGGFHTWYRSSPPQTSVIIAAGKKPFVGFHFALEGGAPPMLADVAKAVANTLKSAIGQAVPSWLMGGRKSASDKKEAQIEPADPMSCRFGLCDHWRQADRLVMSPNRNLSVVSDSLGRIILIDNQKGVAVRMWKGYRETQCGWLEVKEDGKSHHREGGVKTTNHLRTALFLIVYSPKKGIIEIWTMQQGPRIATFSVSKNGRLVYTEYGYMGVNNVHLKGGNKSQFPCVFVDPNGAIKEITVPFHFALSAKNSKRVRDLHLLKKLKTFMKEEDFEEEQLIEEVTTTAEQLETMEVQCQLLDVLSSSRLTTPNALAAALSVAGDKWIAKEPETQDSLVKQLVQLVRRLKNLVSLYRLIYDLNQLPPEYMTVVNTNLTPSVLSMKLQTPEREVSSLLNLVSTIQLVDAAKKKARHEPRVTFGDGGRTTFVEFLSCFVTGNESVNLSGQETANILLKMTASDEELKRISELLYQGTLYSDRNIDEWKVAAALSCIQPAHLMKLALLFWINRRQGIALETEMLRYMELLKAVCSLADVDEICVEYNQLSPWWRDVRSYLIKSSNPFMALTAALVCRAVALSIEKKKDRANNLQEASQDLPNESSDGDSTDYELSRSNSDWENVSSDTCQWSVLVGQLEDVALLSAVLRQKPPVDENESINDKKYCRPFEDVDISLEYFLTKGKGSVSELAAHWLSSSTIDPVILIDRSDIEFENGDESLESDSPSKVKNVGVQEGEKMDVELGAEASNDDETNTKILGLLRLLKRHFPYSLSSSILLTNMCWEFMLLWHKSVDELPALDSAINCLRMIPSLRMRHGLCSLIWSMHLKLRFESSTRLVQKVGKMPKERLCRQEVGLSDLQLTQFLERCLTFIDIYLESSNNEPADSFPLRYEELWPASTVGPPPLAELALSQPTVNFDLLYLHYQLALAVHMMLVFNIKFPRPISSLFDHTSQSAFYGSLTSNQRLPTHNPDTALTATRMQFLFRVISAAMQTIRLREDTDVEGKEPCLDATQAIFWMSRCQRLGSVWSVSSDSLRRHQVCELYSSGFDRMAEETIPAVVDLPLLASQLMLIVGQRMRHNVFTSPDLSEKMSKLSPALSTWLESMPENCLKNTTCPLSDTAQLLTQVMQYLPEEHQEFNLALHMVDAVHAFRDT